MKNNLSIFLTPLVLTLCVRSALATTHTSTDNKSTTILDSMVVKKKNMPITKIGSSTAKITSKQLQKEAASNLSDAFRYIPGVDIATDSRFGISGISMRGLDGDRIYQSVDGVTMADVYDPTGSYISTGRDAIDLSSIESIDVTKGGDVMAGSGALAGAVQFRTKSPSDFLKPTGNSQYRSISTGYRSDSDQYHETLTYAARHGQWEGLLIYTRRDGHEVKSNGHTKGLGTTRGVADPASSSTDNVLAKLNYLLNDHNHFGFIFEHFNNRFSSNLLSQSSSSDDESADDHLYRTHFGFHQDFLARNSFFDRLHWQLDYQEMKSTDGTHINQSATNRYVNRFYDQRSYQLQSKLTKQLGNHRLQYGFNYQFQRYDDLDDDSSSTPTRMTPKAYGNTVGIFAQDLWQLTQNWKILPALRYDYYHYSPQKDTNLGSWDDNNDSALTAQLGSEYALTRHFSLFGKYGTGFRAPKMDEMYYTYIHSVTYNNSTISYAIEPNPNLKPERSIFLEGGLRFKNNYANGEITAYYNRYRNFIETQQEIGTTSTYNYGVYTSLNLDKVVIKGIDAKGRLSLNSLSSRLDGFTLNGAIAYAKGRNVGDAEPLDSVPPLQIGSSLNYESVNQIWGSALHVTWRDAKSSKDLSSSSSWLATPRSTVLDLTAYIKPMKNLTLNAGLFNITNQKYWIWSNIHNASEYTTGNLDRLSEPGRNFSINATYSF